MKHARPAPRKTKLVQATALASVALACLALGMTGPSAAAASEPAPGSADLSTEAPAPGERGLVARLMAPCCATQTLEVHQSEPARELRREIHDRLTAGEAVEAVEASLVARYGERIRATPARDPMRIVALVVLAGVGLAGVFVLRALDRLRRAEKPSEPVAAAEDAHYDARVDAELAELD